MVGWDELEVLLLLIPDLFLTPKQQTRHQIKKTKQKLALAASRQFTTSLAPHGIRRHRENNFYLSHKNQVLPSDVYTEECPFFHPDQNVNESLKDGDEVCVDLVHRMMVDSYGCPMMSKWAYIAFHVSPERERKKERNWLQKNWDNWKYSDGKEFKTQSTKDSKLNVRTLPQCVT